jgi:nitrite reductase/ring-hydroxylating ferredoxin subunit/CDGSH-type Zn-finger protein
MTTPNVNITPTPNGPLHVVGPIQINLPDGSLEHREEAWLCRCGGSASKPFCDGTHNRIGFRSDAATPPAEPTTAPAEPITAPPEATAHELRNGEFRAVAASSHVREGELFEADLDGEPIVLGRLDGVVYALSGLCSHQGAHLAEGELDGCLLVCPLHNGAFDLRTGAPARLPVDTAIARYQVRESDGTVHVGARTMAEKVS